MTDLDRAVEEAENRLLDLMAGPAEPYVKRDALAALEAAITQRATAPLVEAVEGIIADLPALGRRCGSYEQAAEILTERLRSAVSAQ